MITIMMMGFSIWAHFFNGAMSEDIFFQMFSLSPLMMALDIMILIGGR